MNIWVDKIEDIRISINDVFMTLLMTGWMFLLMGLFYFDITNIILGVCLVLINIWCIRTQFMVTPEQYIYGMIPHHSMAIHISKKLLNKYPIQKQRVFIENIIKTQEKEIIFMKSVVL
jgi:hypothetical protein